METQDKISSEVQEKEVEQVQEPEQENTKDWFDIAKSAVLGFFAALAEITLGALMLFGICYWLMVGYNRWFSTDGLIEVGERGYYYDSENECFIKPMPNRRVLNGIIYLECEDGDTIGSVLVHGGNYRYVNLNTLTFINDNSYEHADLFRNGVAIALANDTLYHISPNGEIISSEPSSWIYGSVEEITYLQEGYDSDGDLITKYVSTGLFQYEDANENYGLMSSEFVRLTPAIFSDITAISENVFFCEYHDSGMGVLVDREGNIIK